MECPSCGQRFYSDFRLGPCGKDQGIVNRLFAMPQTLAQSLVRYISKRWFS